MRRVGSYVSGLFIIASCLLASVAHADRAPRHWSDLFETMRALRALTEKIDLKETPAPAEIARLREDVRAIVGSEAGAKALVDHLLGAGMGEAGDLFKDYEVIALKRAAPGSPYGDTLEAAGFRELAEGLGLAPSQNPMRGYFLARLDRELRRIEKMQLPASRVFDAQNRLTSASWIVERVAFIAMIVAGIGVGDLAFHGVSYLGLRDLPLERVAAAIGAGASTTVWGFHWLWPVLERPFAKVFTRGRYKALREACLQLLFLDIETALPRIVNMAIPHGATIQAQEDAALEALLTYRREEVTDALLTVAVANLESGFIKRSVRIFDEIIARGPTSELGQLARAMKSALEAKRDFESELARLKRRYVARNVWRSALCLGAAVGGAACLHPSAISFTQALVFHGIGIAGARALFTKLWTRYPEEELRQRLQPATDKLTESFGELLRVAQQSAQRGGRPGPKLPEVSIAILVGLARNDLPGHAGELLRKAARDALHQFDDDIAMSFLILEAQKQILGEAIRHREPAPHVQEMVNRTLSSTRNCLDQIRKLGGG